jgi:hypothetical protein
MEMQNCQQEIRNLTILGMKPGLAVFRIGSACDQ